MVTEALLDAEIAVLGAILIEPSLMGKSILALRDSDFTAPANRACWQIMRRLWSEGKPADPVLVCEQLRPLYDGNARTYVMELMDLVPSAANIDHYLATLRQRAAMAQISDIAQQIQFAKTLADMQQLLAKASAAAMTKQARSRMNARQMLETFAEDHATEKSPEFLRWSMKKLHRQLDVESGDVVYIAGRPSDGKTAIALQEAWEQAKTERVGFYSLETGDKKVRDRSLCNQILIDRDRIKHNKMTQEDWDRYAAASGDLAGRNIDVIPAAGWTVDEIQADAVEHNYTVVYVDYLQLIRPTNPREINRVNVVSDIARRLKEFGRQTGIIVITICALNRGSVEGEKARRPSNSDLRESGELEYTADVIMFVWRENPNDAKAQRRLYVSKNKEGETGEFLLYFDGKHQLFSDKEIQEPPSPYVQEGFQKITAPDEALPF